MFLTKNYEILTFSSTAWWRYAGALAGLEFFRTTIEGDIECRFHQRFTASVVLPRPGESRGKLVIAKTGSGRLHADIGAVHLILPRIISSGAG